VQLVQLQDVFSAFTIFAANELINLLPSHNKLPTLSQPLFDIVLSLIGFTKSKNALSIIN
jgi:hypothetical protein